MAEGWELVGEARTGLADMVEALSPQQLQMTTLCGDWTPHEVMGHVTMFTDVSLPKFFLGMAKAGFNYDKMADEVAKSRAADLSVGELAASLRANATKKSAMPMFPPEMTLADVAIHTQDVRRGLGLEGSLDEHVVRTALGFLTEHKQAKAIFDTKNLEGLRLEATDMDWSHGSGTEVLGAAEALMMGLAGRDTAAELEGAADRLR